MTVKKKARGQFNTSLMWFRRDLRSYDNAALYHALKQSQSCYCVFVFDTNILNGLPKDDKRVHFIYESIIELKAELVKLGGDLIVMYGDAMLEVPRLAAKLNANAVFINHDYEPTAIARDDVVKNNLKCFNCTLVTSKDQVIFETNEVLSLTEKPYSIFTPYKNAWLRKLEHGTAENLDFHFQPYNNDPYISKLKAIQVCSLPRLLDMGFNDIDHGKRILSGGMQAGIGLLEDFTSRIEQYGFARDFPSIKGPSYLSVHLRFGTVSIRHLVRVAMECIRNGNAPHGANVWLSELIWRDFYFMILSHHPRVVSSAFKPEYDAITWESGANAQELFDAWCQAKTGYPLIDAAMLQLNQTGYMHNRLRMVVASFLVKDLGIDWRWGERYFALRLNDFDLAANNGGWQWAASTGCDAQPYFRIFNPITQSEKFDAEGKFIRRYLPQLAKLNNKQIHAPSTLGPIELEAAGIRLGIDYPHTIIDHKVARENTLARYAIVKK